MELVPHSRGVVGLLPALVGLDHEGIVAFGVVSEGPDAGLEGLGYLRDYRVDRDLEGCFGGGSERG